MILPKPKPVVLLFSGQNGNTVISSRPLYEVSVLFRRHLHRCDDVLRSLGLPGVFPGALEGVQGDSDICLRHAIMFSIQYSCGMSWIDAGVKPEAVCGHSFGEWAALTVAGTLTLEAGMRLVTGYALNLLLIKTTLESLSFSLFLVAFVSSLATCLRIEFANISLVSEKRTWSLSTSHYSIRNVLTVKKVELTLSRGFGAMTQGLW